jgi:beta-lactam-binding protein with PASTA domain
MLRGVTRALGWLTYAILLLAIFTFAGYFSFNLFVRSGVTPVPELVGLPESEVESSLIDHGLISRRLWAADRFDEEVPPGRVLQQSPRSGSLVKRGAAVEVVVSLGPERLRVPEVEGQTLQEAQVTLTASGLGVGRVFHVVSRATPPGTVLLQEPSAESQAGRGTAVDLFLSSANRHGTFVMPDLTYRNFEKVRHYFERRGFRLGSVKFEPYDGISPGIVLRQYPLPGHPLRQQDVISLVVTTFEREGV